MTNRGEQLVSHGKSEPTNLLLLLKKLIHLCNTLQIATPQKYHGEALAGQARKLSMLQKIAMMPHLLIATLLILYFGTSETRNQASVFEDEAFEEPLQDSMVDFKRFIFFAKRNNILYVILPFFFVAGLTSLNYLARYTLIGSMPRRIWNDAYCPLSEKFLDSRWSRDFTLDIKPIVLTSLCFVPPVTIFFMAFVAAQTFVKSLKPTKIKRTSMEERCGQQCIVLKQATEPAHTRKNFYSSGWFNPIIALPFVFGIPAAFSIWIYFAFGVDALFGYPSLAADFRSDFIIIQMYLYGLGACLSALFFRSYFSFCWNFDSLEYDLEIYPDMIKRLPIKGWFFDLLSLASRAHPFEIRWDDVQNIKFSSGRLKPDNTNFDNPAMALFGKLTTVYESLAQKLEMNSDYLQITDRHNRELQIRLWELNKRQKLELFQAIRLYCPAVHLDERVQQALVGSSVMREPQYTQIWFSVLTDKSENYVSGDLAADHKLQDGRYTIIRKMASGGQAVIYEALDDSARKVVLKEFRLTTGESFDARIESAKDFENESAVLSQLNHDAIVKMDGMFYEDGRVYLALEHIEGRSLRELVLEAGPLQKGEILALAEKMCHILQYLHGQEPSVVHRDFTPDNIILQENGALKLIDFSIAQRKAKTKVNDCAGKHAYTPPEQFGGMAVAQSDLYALGGTLYYLATGKDPEPLTQLRLDTSVGDEEETLLQKVIETCTALNLSQRYESAQWVLNELRSETAVLPVLRCNHEQQGEASESEPISPVPLAQL